MMLLLAAAYFIQMVIHEAGHLVFGLFTGYKFLSFRIGSLMLIKDGEKFSFRRFSIAGTGGQCLMAPPDMTDGRFPFVLYNLGGVIMNLIATAAFFLLWLPLKAVPFLSTFLLELAAVGIEKSVRTLRTWRSKLVQDMTVLLFGVDGAVSIEAREPKQGQPEEGGADGQLCGPQ